MAWLPMPAWLAGTLIGAAPGAATLGLGTLVPLHVQGWPSDGRGLLDLARRTPDAALQVQINLLMALSLAGVRPRDWPASAMPADDGAAASAGLRLSRAIDARDADGARADALALADAFAGAPAIFQGVIAVSLASHAALLVGDRALVAAWRRRCEGGLMDLSPYRTWLDAEIARLDGDAATCAAHRERARPHRPDSGCGEPAGARRTAVRARAGLTERAHVRARVRTIRPRRTRPAWQRAGARRRCCVKLA